MLLEQKKENRVFAAICASPAVVLATHGLITDVSATSYPSFGKDLPKPADEDCRVVVDGNVVTSRAPGTALEVAYSCPLASFLISGAVCIKTC